MEAPHAEKKTHTGSCHCGELRFQVELDARHGSKCNCTICTKVGGTNAIAPPSAFTLLTSLDGASMYEWGGKTGQRYFCKRCGVHVFGKGHLAELGGDYVSVNLNCLDDIDLRSGQGQGLMPAHREPTGGPELECDRERVDRRTPADGVGSADELRKAVNDAGVKRFGSGWTWLIHDGTGLAVVSTPNQDNPVMTSDTPLLGIDVWEHAYYLKYQNRRPDYLEAWWNVVDWSAVEGRFAQAAK